MKLEGGGRLRGLKDEQIIAALLSNPTIRDAAHSLEIPESRIYSRLRNEQFSKKYSEARQRLLRQTTTYLQGLVSEAVEKIRSVMNDPESSRQTSLNAAAELLRVCYKMTEQADVIDRLDKLEQIVEAKE